MMILGEHYDEYLGFDCDNYDAYDPFEGESGDDLFEQIAEAFGANAEEIIADIICGRSVDSAIQSHFID